MAMWNDFWHDQSGLVVSAETVMVGSVAVLGGLVGLNVAADAVHGEMVDLASGIRSLDQSYVIAGHRGCRAWTAGSYFIQQPVETSISELCGEGPANPAVLREQIDADRTLLMPAGEPPLANDLPPKSTDMKKKSDEKKPDPKKTKKNKKDGDEE